MTTTFSEIQFDEASHTYTLHGQPLTSVTKIISRLKPPFDAPAVAARVAERDGRAVAEVLAEWEEKRQASLDRGTHVHRYIAAKILSTGELSPYDPAVEYLHTPPRLPEMDAFDRWWDGAAGSNESGAIEWVVGDAKLGVAGTVDAMFWNAYELGNVIFDWKTGGKYATDNRFEKLLPPFDDLPNCEHSLYSLQTSLYRLIIERNRAEVKACYILHLGGDGVYTPHKCRDLRDRLLVWLAGEK
jgi:hypothetical protein